MESLTLQKEKQNILCNCQHGESCMEDRTGDIIVRYPSHSGSCDLT